MVIYVVRGDIGEREIQVQEPPEEVFNGDDARYNDPVHEPWGQLVLIIRLESFVTREYREQKRDYRANTKSAYRYKGESRMSHDKEGSGRDGGRIRDKSTDNAKHEISQQATQQIQRTQGSTGCNGDR